MRAKSVFTLIMLVLLGIAGVVNQDLLLVTTMGFMFVIAVLADARDELMKLNKQREKSE